MKLLLIIFALLVAGTLALYSALQNGRVLRYIDTHPHGKRVPALAFYIGGGYYIWGDLQNAATYYLRVTERYPNSKHAEDALFNYLQALDDMNTPRAEMAEKYSTYLERYPAGNYAEIVQKRIEFCRNSR